MDSEQVALLCQDNDALANWISSKFSKSILTALCTVLAGRTGPTIDPSLVGHVVARLSLYEPLRSRLCANLRAGTDPGSLIRGVARTVGHEILREHRNVGRFIDHLAPDDYLRLAIAHDTQDTNRDRTALLTRLCEERKALPKQTQRVLRERLAEGREFDKIASRMNSDRGSPEFTPESIKQLFESALAHLRTRLAPDLPAET